MSDYGKCKRCGEYVWDQKCSCKLFFYWLDIDLISDESEAHEVYALNAERAAERAVYLYYFADGYPIDGPDDYEIWIRDGCAGEVQAFFVECEYVPRFYASRCRPIKYELDKVSVLGGQDGGV